MKVSIVIPTMTLELVEKCVASIIEFTDLNDKEIIVVANGASPNLRDYVDRVGDSGVPMRCLWFDDPLGAVIALNEGIKEATGEYVLLLNDDCQLLPHPKNQWIDSLLVPFSDPMMGCTGPFKMDSGMNHQLITNVDREFILFFCALIPNKLFKELGILDEELKCGVDIDFCIRLGLAGYKIQQVPEQRLQHSDVNNKLLVGDFPIYHQGEGTVHDHYGFDTWQGIIQDDIAHLNDKYANTVQEPKGFFSNWDTAVYRQIVDSLPDGGCFAEVGSLEGKSLCSVADIILKKNLKVFAVDLFDDFYDELFGNKFDNQLLNFTQNTKNFGIFDNIEIMRGPSVEMANLIKDSFLDMVFLDADHTTPSVTSDLNAWYPKVKPGGIIAGHDFEWPSVKEALNNVIGLDHVFQEYNRVYSSNCWFTSKPKIYDGFMFFNEIDVLEIRLAETYDAITKFIIVEGARKINGEPNEKMYFTNNKERYAKYMDKIIHVVVDEFPENPKKDPWEFERHLRDSIASQWSELNDRDIVMVSDCDEIPRASVISNYKLKDGFSSLVQNIYYDYLNNYSGRWEWVKILPYYLARNMTPCQIRYTEAQNKIQNGGWHFTFLGGAEKIREKITSYAHQEYNTPEYLDGIEDALETGKDIFKREGVTKTAIPIDNSFPKFVQDNIDWYTNKGYVRKVEQLRPIPRGEVYTGYTSYPWHYSNPITVDWPVFQKKYELLMLQEFLCNEDIVKVLEIGTCFGGTTLLFAHMVAPKGGMVYTCDLSFTQGYVDTYGIEHDDQVYTNSPYRKYITEIQGDSHNKDFIEQVKKQVGLVDLLLIDGDHSYEGVKQDFEEFISLVRPNGFIALHDIVDSDYHRDRGCFVAQFWNEIKNKYYSWEFIDSNGYNGAGPSKSMGIGIIKKMDNLGYVEGVSTWKEVPETKEVQVLPSGKDVLCSICTKNRYDSTLSLALQSVCMQTVKPGGLIIYDDNIDSERKDLRENETYRYLFDMLDFSGIKWEFVFGAQKGQHHGHQVANKKGYKFVWRLDDDEIAAPDVLEKYLRLMTDDVGAVGGTVLTKGYGGEGSNRMEHIYSSPNIQWTVGTGVVEVDHLHSTFLYRANIVDYNLELSPVAHREETIFTYELKLKGYRILVDRSAVTHHLKQQSTGIRSHSSAWFYEHDERVFSKKMESWGYKLLNLDSGIGDHLAFLNILPDLKKKWKHLIIGACFPEVFKDHPDVTLVHIGQSAPVNDENIYKWMWDNNWKTSIVDAYATYYEVK